MESLTQHAKNAISVPQEYQWRYQGVVNALEMAGTAVLRRDNAVVVEIGPSDHPKGSLGSFLPLEDQVFIGIDRREDHLKATQDKYTGRMVADADSSISLKSASVDLLVSTDVIEHMGLGERKDFFNETGRVLKPGGIMICGFPEGENSKRLDNWFNEKYKKQTGINHPYLVEHIEYGLPELVETLAQIEAAGMNIYLVNANCNQLLWRFDNWAYIIRPLESSNKLENVVLRTASLALAKTLIYADLINRGKTYRKIVVAQKLQKSDNR